MARTDPQLNIRLPADLKEKLERVAKMSGRSVTAEIVKRLGESFERPSSTYTHDDLVDLVNFVTELSELKEKHKR